MFFPCVACVLQSSAVAVVDPLQPFQCLDGLSVAVTVVGYQGDSVRLQEGLTKHQHACHGDGNTLLERVYACSLHE